MPKVRFALVGAALLFTTGAHAQSSIEPFLGEVGTFGFNFCPKGWAEMNGQVISISQNTALFSLLGTTYGGNGQTTFALPTGMPVFTATGVPLRQCIALEGIFPSRD